MSQSTLSSIRRGSDVHGESVRPSEIEAYVNPIVSNLAGTICILCLVALLNACGEPMYEHAGSPHSLPDDREACVKEIEQSPDALAYRQNPTAHPDYLNRIFPDMNRCIERKGWKLLSTQPQQTHEPVRSEFAQTNRLAPHADDYQRN